MVYVGSPAVVPNWATSNNIGMQDRHHFQRIKCLRSRNRSELLTELCFSRVPALSMEKGVRAKMPSF